MSTENVKGNLVKFYRIQPWNQERHRRFFSDDGESPIITDLLDRLHSDDVFFDVGGFVGVYAILAAKCSGVDSVRTFEPRPYHRHLIELNAELNDVSIDIDRRALGAWNGKMKLNVPGRPRVTVQTGDNIAERTNGPTVLKIDVEGLELDVLRGFENYLEQCRLIYVEIHPQSKVDYGITKNGVEVLRRILRNAGLSVETIHERSGQPFLRAMRND